MSGFGIRVALGAVALSASACIIVNDPPPPPRQPPPPRSPAAVAPAATPVAATATPAPTVAPVATTISPNAGAAGPHTTVNGKDYVTLRAPNVFGDGNNTAGSWHGLVYFLPAGTTAVPNYDAMTALGAVFTRTLAVPAGAFSGGFPGIDQTRNENFGIRYEGSFTVAVTGDYLFRLTSDDGAKLSIDNLPIANDDGAHPPRDATGHLQLAAGVHNFRLDYFQGGGGIALSVHVTPPNAAEKPFAQTL
jgi:hypothetical protein